MLSRSLLLWSLLLMVLLTSCRAAGPALARVEPAHRDPMPEARKMDRIRLVFIGDTGERNEAMEAVRPSVRDERADLVVVLGDLVYPAEAAWPVNTHMVRWFNHYLKDQKNGENEKIGVSTTYS